MAWRWAGVMVSSHCPDQDCPDSQSDPRLPVVPTAEIPSAPSQLRTNFIARGRGKSWKNYTPVSLAQTCLYGDRIRSFSKNRLPEGWESTDNLQVLQTSHWIPTLRADLRWPKDPRARGTGFLKLPVRSLPILGV